jgi:AraC-like DNA-binding protein
MIGNTRQVGEARSVLRIPTDAPIQHKRWPPRLELEAYVAHYWSVTWDLRGREPQLVQTLPHPNVHLVFDDKGATVDGVHTARFTTTLEGQSGVFGVKFQPGGYRPFCDGPISQLADRTVEARPYFGDVRAEGVEAFLVEHLPARIEPNIVTATAVVDLIFRDSSLRTVDELALRTGIGKRSLQRLFSEYVGASPKWVIRRYRLHEALERLQQGVEVNSAAMAADLGYFDQAHLINDFKSIVGMTPAQYQKLVRPPEPSQPALPALAP